MKVITLLDVVNILFSRKMQNDNNKAKEEEDGKKRNQKRNHIILYKWVTLRGSRKGG